MNRIASLSGAVDAAIASVDADIASARAAWEADTARMMAHEDVVRKALERSSASAVVADGDVGAGGLVGGVGFLGPIVGGGGAAISSQRNDEDLDSQKSSNSTPDARASKRRQGVAHGNVADP